MSYQIIFIDVDGTLCTPRGDVPESAKTAIRNARNNGRLVYLCTGRSLPELTQEIREIGFDGLICAGGSYIEIGGKKEFHRVMEEEDALFVIDYLKKKNIGFYVETNEGVFPGETCIPMIKKVVTRGLVPGSEKYEKAIHEMTWFIDLLKAHQAPRRNYDEVNKISFINDLVPFEEIINALGGRFYIHRSTVAQFGTDSGEISIKGITKRTAIEYVLGRVNRHKGQAAAYGDSYNDVDMFQAVGHSVAMGNANDQLKQMADEVTQRVEENGIFNSFVKNKLI